MNDDARPSPAVLEPLTFVATPATLGAIFGQLDRFHGLLHSVVTLSTRPDDEPTEVDILHDSLTATIALLEFELLGQLCPSHSHEVAQVRRLNKTRYPSRPQND